MSAAAPLSKGQSVTKTLHSEPYPAVSPLRPEVSQAGRTILITGGATGIGFATARAFAQAGAATVVIAGRRADVIESAVSKLSSEFASRSLQVLGLSCDVGDSSSIDALWTSLREKGLTIDTLVLSAGMVSGAKPILEVGADGVSAGLLINLHGHVRLVERLYKQEGRDPSKRLAVINVSTGAIHDFVLAGAFPAYSLTKNAGTLAVQLIAKDVQPEDMQIVSFHPGLVRTDMSSFLEEDKYQWVSVDLAAHFALWAASKEAAFLHGRFVWAEWDVEELKAGPTREKIDGDHTYLQIGVHGL